MALLALQAISNLIFDWNRDQGERQYVEDIEDLLEDLGKDHLAARPAGEAEGHPDPMRSDDDKTNPRQGQD